MKQGQTPFCHNLSKKSGRISYEENRIVLNGDYMDWYDYGFILQEHEITKDIAITDEERKRLKYRRV